MRVSLSVLAAFLASNQHLVSAFQPSRDVNRQHPNIQQQEQDPDHPRQSTRLNDASAVPYLSSWKILPEGNIQGVIFGHPFLENGDVVTTSQIKDSESASENQIIETESGSHYLLRDRDANEQMASEAQNSFNNNVAGSLLGGAALAAGAVGLGVGGESARFDSAAPAAQAFKELSAVSLNQFQNSAKSLGESIDMPYLASKVSEAEKQFQSARENMFKQKGPEFNNNAAAPSVVAAQKEAQKFEQALSVAAEKVAIEKAALNEKVAWEKFVDNEIAKEKAEIDVMNSASSAATQALSENKFDAAKAATEKAQMARAAVIELQAERESAILAEESAEAEELFAEQDVMKVIGEIKQMATLYSAKAAGFKPADALYYLEDLNPKIGEIGEYLSTQEGQTAVGSLAAATVTGAVWAGTAGTAKTKDEEKEETSTAASPVASSSTAEKVVPEPARAAQPAPVAAAAAAKSTTTTPAASSSTASNTAAATKSSWGSYLDVLGSYGTGTSAGVPSSYSPFGKKPAGVTSHTSLYSAPTAEYVPPPPVAAAAPSPTTVSSAAATTATAAAAAATTAATAATATTTTPPPPTTMPAQEQPRSMSGSSGYLDALSGPPGAAVMTSYSPFGTKSPASPQPKKKPQPEIAAHIRLAYKEWCEYYGKQSDESRLEIFAKNFADAKEFYKESGRALLLNEYADLTVNEYKLLPNAA
mmetsp:Transcript_13694/g.33171  ORF Transcript_13694/g.33171 Transcript_13694/m.33171 type:complete len:704 (+) Transcript_13694:86-2197(+)